MKFQNLFKKAQKPVTTEAENIDTESASDFEQETTGKSSPAEENIDFKKFLDADYEQTGYKNGYDFHNMDLMDGTIKGLGAKFRLHIDEIIDRKKAYLGTLSLHLIDATGVSTRLDQALQEKITQIKNIILDLTNQKELSIEKEGLISHVIHNYRTGFIKGVYQYNYEKFIAGSTGLF